MSVQNASESASGVSQGTPASTSRVNEPWMRILDNPLLTAMAQLRLRKKDRTSLTWVTGLIGVSGALIGLASGKESEWGVMYFLMLGFAALQLLYRGVNVLAGLMVQERTSGILEFHRATPTSPYTDALGYLIGGAAREYFQLGLMAPFMLLYGMAADIAVWKVVASLLILVVNGILFHCMALLVGLTGASKRVTNATVIAALFLVSASIPLYQMGLVTPAFLSPVPATASLFNTSETLTKVGGTVLFFGIPLHPIFFTLLVQLSIIGFLFKGIARKLQNERLPIFSRTGAIALFVTVTVLTIGGSWAVITDPNLSAESGTMNPRDRIAALSAAYLAGAGLLSTALLISLVPHYLDFSRALRRARRLGVPFPGWLEDGATALPLVPVFFLLSCGGFGIMVAIGSGFLELDKVFSIYTLVALTGTLTGIAFFTTVVEYVRLSVRGSQRSYLLILFLTCIFPFILTAVLGAAELQDVLQYVAALSPLFGTGGSAMAMAGYWMAEEGEFSLWTVLFSQGVTLVASGWLTWQSRTLLLKLADAIPLGGKKPESLS